MRTRCISSLAILFTACFAACVAPTGSGSDPGPEITGKGDGRTARPETTLAPEGIQLGETREGVFEAGRYAAYEWTVDKSMRVVIQVDFSFPRHLAQGFLGWDVSEAFVSVFRHNGRAETGDPFGAWDLELHRASPPVVVDLHPDYRAPDPTTRFLVLVDPNDAALEDEAAFWLTAMSLRKVEARGPGNVAVRVGMLPRREGGEITPIEGLRVALSTKSACTDGEGMARLRDVPAGVFPIKLGRDGLLVQGDGFLVPDDRTSQRDYRSILVRGPGHEEDLYDVKLPRSTVETLREVIGLGCGELSPRDRP